MSIILTVQQIVRNLIGRDKPSPKEEYVKETCYIVAEKGYIKGIYSNPSDLPDEHKDNYQDFAIPIQNGVLRLPSEIDRYIIDRVMDFWCMGGRGCRFETPSFIVKVLVIPKTYQIIGQKNFSKYEVLETLYLPKNIELCEFAFAYCPNLTKVYIGIEPGEEHYARMINKEQAMSLFHHRWGIFDDCNESIQFYIA